MTRRADPLETRARERRHRFRHRLRQRRFGRSEAKRRFTRAAMEAWLRDRGVLLAGAADLDESPMAYRRLPDVLAHHADTVKVLHTLRPFAVAMAGEGEFDPWKD
jgi:tRNA-splicing ligase RtcB (3'-phosphate/5'-hydroxy nucleic acid ligase)